MRVLWVVVAILLAGCAAPTPGAPEPRTADPSLPPIAEPEWDAPVRLGGATNGAEPQAIFTSKGTLLVHTPLQLWRSRDAGRTFEALGEPSCDAPQGVTLPNCLGGEMRRNPGLVGPNDGAMAELADGRLLWAGLEGSGYHVPAQFSADEGTSWSKPEDLADRSSDREWLVTRADGLVLAVWRQVNAAVTARISHDNGTTWLAPVEVAADHLLGPPVVHPSGSLFIPMYALGPEEGLRVGRSTDDGATWEVIAATAVETNAPIRNGGPIAVLPVMAIDEGGALHVAWAGSPLQAETFGVKAADVPRVHLTTSRDQGTTWSDPVTLDPEGPAAILPWIVAGVDGRVALAWYENERSVPNEFFPDSWRVRVVLVANGSLTSSTFVTEAPVHIGQACTDGAACLLTARERALLDMLGLALAPDGSLVVVYAGNGGTPRGPIHVYAARTANHVGLR